MACGDGFVGALCDLFVPTVGLGDRFTGLRTTLEGRFPFSVAAQLGGFFTGGTGDGGEALPTQLLFMPLPFDQLAPFFATVKLVVTVLILAGLGWYLVDRFTPQAVI